MKDHLSTIRNIARFQSFCNCPSPIQAYTTLLGAGQLRQRSPITNVNSQLLTL